MTFLKYATISTFEIPDNIMNQEKTAQTVSKLHHDSTNRFLSTVARPKNKSVTFCYFYRSKTRYLEGKCNQNRTQTLFGLGCSPNPVFQPIKLEKRYTFVFTKCHGTDKPVCGVVGKFRSGLCRFFLVHNVAGDLKS